MADVRGLRAEDARAFWDLRLEALRKNPVAFLASAEEFASLSEARLRAIFIDDFISEAATEHVWGAFEEDELVGMMCLSRSNNPKTRHKATLWGVYVRDEVRGQGVAQGLMAAVLTEAGRMADLRQVQLSVAAVNKRAIRFYESFGFEQFAISPRVVFWNDVFYDDVEMIKYLDA